MGSSTARLRPWLPALLAGLLLAGCGTVGTTARIPIYQQFNETAGYIPPKLLSKIPASLGFLLPSVPNYECRGAYTPAQRAPFSPTLSPTQLGLPFWQLLVQCTDPKLHLHLPKGRIQAGLVWINEQPGNPAAALQNAMHVTQGLTDVRLASLGKLRVGEGYLPFGGYRVRILWFTRGATTWISDGKRVSAPVLVYITGRAVPLRVLEKFAESMQPAAGAS